MKATLFLFSTVSSLQAEGVVGIYSDGEFSLSAKESTRRYDSTTGWAINGGAENKFSPQKHLNDENMLTDVVCHSM